MLVLVNRDFTPLSCRPITIIFSSVSTPAILYTWLTLRPPEIFVQEPPLSTLLYIPPSLAQYRAPLSGLNFRSWISTCNLTASEASYIMFVKVDPPLEEDQI